MVANSFRLNDHVPASWSQNLEFYSQISRRIVLFEFELAKGWVTVRLSDYTLFLRSLKPTMQGRVFGITENGWMVVFLEEAVSEDLICVFDHVTPFFIRSAGSRSSEPSGKGQIFRLIGKCYIYVIMDVKNLRDIRERGVELFVLV